jgi:hypothetical protein
MGRRALPTALALGAFVADVAGAHTFALVALVGAIPATFVLMLDCYGDLLAARCGLMRPIAAAVGLLLIVFSAALRSPAVVGGVPRLSISAAALAALFTFVALAGAVAPAVTRAVAATEADSRDEERRLAA